MHDDRPLPPGEIGEVLVRGEAVMQGYWRNPEATRADAAQRLAAYRRRGHRSTHDGFLTLRDRSKDLIISGGSNIYPREVEEVLLRHPAVSEVSVVGRPHPDWGEEVVAFVVLQPGAQATAGGARCAVPAAHRALQAARSSIASWTVCRRTTTARC